MKLLVDLNLSPSWIDRLAGHGFEAVHWSSIGAPTAPDVEILTWAREHQFVVVTNDLDFSAILAAKVGATPSVVQIRTQDLLSDAVVSIVRHALEAHREHIERGALLSIDEGGTRVRVLPLRRSTACRSTRRPYNHPPVSPPWFAPRDTPEGEQVGELKLGSTVPPTTICSFAKSTARDAFDDRSRLDVLANQ